MAQWLAQWGPRPPLAALEHRCERVHTGPSLRSEHRCVRDPTHPSLRSNTVGGDTPPPPPPPPPSQARASWSSVSSVSSIPSWRVLWTRPLARISIRWAPSRPLSAAFVARMRDCIEDGNDIS
ncbi:hypothetical protein FB451DRAFT_1404743 [Mycena latifolia]|nr:hypothetical protein FB451DRAFT_1404743 [Mycena latifolia]